MTERRRTTTAGSDARLFVAVAAPGKASLPASASGRAQTRSRLGKCGAAVFLAVALVTSAPPAAGEVSEREPLAAHSLLLDVARAGGRLVAVGDRGHVLVSSDEGRSWSQRLVPTRAMLTGVSFPDASHGWAVGHDGVILATRDGGETWTRQDSGRDLETIFLDVLFLTPREGFAVGAYGRFAVTIDGGATWTAGRPPIEGDVHFNRISRRGPDLYLAGEAGTLLCTADGGRQWNKTEIPCESSLYGVLPCGTNGLVAFGLRGHILQSSDRGARWMTVANDVKVLIMGGVDLGHGLVVLGGLGGNFFVSRNDGRNFTPWQPAGFGTGVASLIGTTDGAIVAVGEAGATRLKPP